MKAILFFFLLTLNAYGATQPSGCGVYDVYGVLKAGKVAGEYNYVVHAGTVSEYKFLLNAVQEIKLIPYLDRSSKIRVKLDKAITDYHGTFAEVLKAEDVVPDPAGLTKNHGFFEVKKEKCK